jgi:ABC-2 type transport system permease protein
MSRTVSRAAIVSAIVKKDFVEFSRDTLYLFLSILGLVFFIGFFWIAPNTVTETLTLGVHQTGMDKLFDQYQEGADTSEGLKLVQFSSEEELRKVVSGEVEYWESKDGTQSYLRDKDAGDDKPKDAKKVSVAIGIGFPAGFLEKTAAKEKTVVTVYSDAGVPTEIQGAMKSFVREIAYSLAGDAVPVTEPAQENIILGTDRAGDQVSLREKMRPMLALFVLMIEVLSMASLVSTEVLTRTVTAVLVTPATAGDFLMAKTIYGTMLAMSQAMIVLIAIGAFTASNWWLLLLTMLVGSVMFTGVAMIVGAAGKDFLGTLFYSMLFLLPLMIPAFSILLPGTASAWIRFLPTYGMTQVLAGVTAYGLGWADVWQNLAAASAWVVVIYLAGLFTLKRKVESL